MCLKKETQVILQFCHVLRSNKLLLLLLRGSTFSKPVKDKDGAVGATLEVKNPSEVAPLRTFSLQQTSCESKQRTA